MSPTVNIKSKPLIHHLQLKQLLIKNEFNKFRSISINTIHGRRQPSQVRRRSVVKWQNLILKQNLSKTEDKNQSSPQKGVLNRDCLSPELTQNSKIITPQRIKTPTVSVIHKNMATIIVKSQKKSGKKKPFKHLRTKTPNEISLRIKQLKPEFKCRSPENKTKFDFISIYEKQFMSQNTDIYQNECSSLEKSNQLEFDKIIEEIK